MLAVALVLPSVAFGNPYCFVYRHGQSVGVTLGGSGLSNTLKVRSSDSTADELALSEYPDVVLDTVYPADGVETLVDLSAHPQFLLMIHLGASTYYDEIVNPWSSAWGSSATTQTVVVTETVDVTRTVVVTETVPLYSYVGPLPVSVGGGLSLPDTVTVTPDAETSARLEAGLVALGCMGFGVGVVVAVKLGGR